LIGGIETTVGKIKQAGIAVLLTTITWRFAAEYFQNRFGFDAASGVEMGEDESGYLTGKVTCYFDEYNKATFVENYCRERNVSFEECVAVGDSRSDIPLFQKVGFAIGLNATPEAREIAHVCVDTKDLTEILKDILTD